jgi:hypothetical protein
MGSQPNNAKLIKSGQDRRGVCKGNWTTNPTGATNGRSSESISHEVRRKSFVLLPPRSNFCGLVLGIWTGRCSMKLALHNGEIDSSVGMHTHTHPHAVERYGSDRGDMIARSRWVRCFPCCLCCPWLVTERCGNLRILESENPPRSVSRFSPLPRQKHRTSYCEQWITRSRQPGGGEGTPGQQKNPEQVVLEE